MVGTAGLEAVVRNLTRFDIAWANQMLTNMEWADSLLRKATMWLAFLGASLATYNRKHIGIDALLMIAPKRPKYGMLALGGLLAGFITFGLAYAFGSAVHLNLTERPIEYEMLGDNGSIHVCDATDAQLKQIEDFERPEIFCVARRALNALSIPAETPGAAFQLIVPIMFLVMAMRLLGQGITSTRVFFGGDAAIAEAEAEEHRRSEQTQASVRPKGADEA
jgi:TRAP-type C4-dicarboxylate transport system permease small subunit